MNTPWRSLRIEEAFSVLALLVPCAVLGPRVLSGVLEWGLSNRSGRSDDGAWLLVVSAAAGLALGAWFCRPGRTMTRGMKAFLVPAIVWLSGALAVFIVHARLLVHDPGAFLVYGTLAIFFDAARSVYHTTPLALLLLVIAGIDVAPLTRTASANQSLVRKGKSLLASAVLTAIWLALAGRVA